jgi:hypothetical protein
MEDSAKDQCPCLATSSVLQQHCRSVLNPPAVYSLLVFPGVCPLQEAKVLSSSDHPNIVRLLGGSLAPPCIFLVGGGVVGLRDGDLFWPCSHHSIRIQAICSQSMACVSVLTPLLQAVMTAQLQVRLQCHAPSMLTPDVLFAVLSLLVRCWSCCPAPCVTSATPPPATALSS